MSCDRCIGPLFGLEAFVSKLIRALERAGLVRRSTNPSDSRARRLRITERGVEAVTAGRKVVLQLEEQRLAPLGGRSSERSAELRETLQTLLRHALALEAGRAASVERLTAREATQT